MNSIKEAYRDFLNTPFGADVYRKFKYILYTAQDSLVQTLDTQILQFLPAVQGESVRVCDIGGGDGVRAASILTFLHGKFRNHFELDFIEQSEFYVREFRRHLPQDFCRTQVLHSLFENTALPQQYYDLVLLIHSIFAFENGKALDKVLSLRNPNGKVVVVSNAPNSFLGGLKRLVDQSFKDKRYEIDELQSSLDREGVRFLAWPFETTCAIERSQWEQDISVILNWISLGRFPSFTTEKKREIFSYIDDNTAAEKNRIFFSEKEVVLVIPDTNQRL